MQGIYKEFPLMLEDIAMTCIIDCAQDPYTGISKHSDVIRIIEMSGYAGIVKE